jgi:hypothetical protein
VASVEKDDPPPVASLAHYTNLAGFRGIIESGHLWASNVAFLNDKEELLHGVKCAKRVVTNVLKDSKLRLWRDAVGDVVKQIEDGRLPNTYAACFCERTDLLSQWRAYGGNEQGISIAFDLGGLRLLASGKRSFLAPVEYGLIHGKATLRRNLRERLLAINEDDFIAMDESEKRDTVYNVLSELIPRFKHKGFEDEREWRLAVQHATLRSSVNFRVNKNVIVPYVSLGNHPLPIKYVRIGPGVEMDLTKRSISIFLEAKGYDVRILSSGVPFRT